MQKKISKYSIMHSPFQLLFSSSIFFYCSFTFAQDTWSQKKDFQGTGRFGAVGFSIGTQGYVGMGSSWDTLTSTYVCFNDFWEWDQATNTWTQKADFGGTARRKAVGFSIGKKAYVGTGEDSTKFYQDFWEWDQATNTWIQKTPLPGLPRSGGISFSMGTKGYIGLGRWHSKFGCSDLWEWNQVTDTWTKMADFPGRLIDETAFFSIGDKGYVGIGGDSLGVCSIWKDFWQWDQITNSWAQKTDFPGNSRMGAAGFSIGTKGYIGGGSCCSIDYPDLWEYDPATDTWIKKNDFAGLARGLGVSFSIGSKIYIGLGRGVNPFYKKDFWEFSPNGTGIQTFKNENYMTVFPNPFYDISTVSIKSKINFPFDLVITDLYGKEVQRIPNLHQNNFQLARNELPAGIYLATIFYSNNKLIATEKIIIK